MPLTRFRASPFWGRPFLGGLLLALLIVCATSASSAEVSPEKLKALKSRIQDINSWLKDAEGKRSDLQQSLQTLETEIGTINSRIHDLEQKASTLKDQLQALSDREQQLRDRLETQRNALKAQIRAAWMQGDSPAIKVLLNEADPQRLSRTMTYYEYLNSHNVQELEQVNRMLQALDQTRQKTQDTRKSLDETLAQAQDQRANIAKRKQARQQTLAKLQDRIGDKRAELKKAQADQARLEKLLRQVEAAAAEAPPPDSNAPFARQRAKLPWPTHGKVVGDFGDPLAEGKLRRNGILIATEQDAPVTAVGHGRVVFANWLRGFGLLIIIDHGHGYMSLYGHNSSLLKSPGDRVSAGETIALAGSSGGATVTGLYFEIRHKGAPANPEHWLRPQH